MSGKGVEDRAIGALVGLAVGDAIGTTLEFSVRDSGLPLTDMVGGGPFALQAGQWTDDTAMALALADTLCSEIFDEAELLSRFVTWWQHGYYSCTGTCFDIGVTTQVALQRWLSSGERHCGSTDPASAGNGSLMRLAPVAIRFWSDAVRRREIAERQCRTTHAASAAVDACVVFSDILADAIAGAAKADVLRSRRVEAAAPVADIVAGSWRRKDRTEIKSSGYVVHSLEAAFWCVDRTDSFANAVLLAANLGDDADTTAAITGQLAGACYGASSIPERWLAKLAWHEKIRETARSLLMA